MPSPKLLGFAVESPGPAGALSTRTDPAEGPRNEPPQWRVLVLVIALALVVAGGYFALLLYDLVSYGS